MDANYIKHGSPATANNKINTGKKFSWVKRLMKNNTGSSVDRYNKPASLHHLKRATPSTSTTTAATRTTTMTTDSAPIGELGSVPRLQRDQLVEFERSPSVQSSSNDLLSRIPILSLSSQSMNSSSLEGDDSQQSTTATSILPTTATNHHLNHYNPSSNYIHLNTMHNHALDDSSIVTLASSNRRCRSLDSNTNLSTLGIPPLSIIERQQISLNNGITSPNSPILSAGQSRYSGTGGADSGSIKTHWTLEKQIGEE